MQSVLIWCSYLMDNKDFMCILRLDFCIDPFMLCIQLVYFCLYLHPLRSIKYTRHNSDRTTVCFRWWCTLQFLHLSMSDVVPTERVLRRELQHNKQNIVDSNSYLREFICLWTKIRHFLMSFLLFPPKPQTLTSKTEEEHLRVRARGGAFWGREFLSWLLRLIYDLDLLYEEYVISWYSYRILTLNAWWFIL